MIFFALGTCPFQFERLVKIADEYAKKTGEEVFVQTGHTKYTPEFCSSTSFLSKKDYLKKLINSKVFIAHAGIGVVLDVKKYNKKIILVPRVASLDEHTDEHQQELAKFMAEQRNVDIISDDMDMDEIIRIINTCKKQESMVEDNLAKDMLINKLSKYIEELSGKTG